MSAPATPAARTTPAGPPGQAGTIVPAIPRPRPAAPARVAVPALGSTAVLAVADPAALDTARQVMAAELAALDEACSRFRADSEISLLHARRPRRAVGPLLAEAEAALRAAG